MLLYRSRLPPWFPDDAPVFMTWRFLQHDARLDRSDFGPVWLRDPLIASMLTTTLQYGETVPSTCQAHGLCPPRGFQ
jgi:hypothetical protein